MSERSEPRIQSEEEYQAALATLSKASQPPALLRLLMRAFEGYRAARKMGWSRPWNKYDLLNFASYRLRPAEDQPLIQAGLAVVAADFPMLPAAAAGFLHELVADPELMGFLFCHDYQQAGRSWEGVTLSLGRKVQRRYRDRCDLILEAEVVEGSSRGLSRLRLYVDPYSGGPAAPIYSAVCEAPGLGASELFGLLSQRVQAWSQQPERVWDHWTSRYIDYFGPRRQLPRHSAFPPAVAATAQQA